MKKVILLVILAALLLPACALTDNSDAPYLNITAQEAKQMMDTQKDYIILDVRTQEEHEQLRIPGSILIPDDEIRERALEELPDKNQLILIYSRSGNRSKDAAEILLELGYTNIREFGGINDWPYETESLK